MNQITITMFAEKEKKGIIQAIFLLNEEVPPPADSPRDFGVKVAQVTCKQFGLVAAETFVTNGKADHYNEDFGINMESKSLNKGVFFVQVREHADGLSESDVRDLVENYLETRVQLGWTEADIKEKDPTLQSGFRGVVKGVDKP